MDSSRRNFLKAAGIAGAASLGHRSAEASMVTGAKAPKNLIFLVADGMGTGTLTATHVWQKQMGGTGLEWFDMYREPELVRCFQDTASANAPVTDSAAAASAWGGGKRVNNGVLNITPSGKRTKPLFQLAKEAGKAVGLVSTCRVTHATPAGFLVNHDDRDDEDAIAGKFLELEMDVHMGGGRRHFEREDADLVSEFAKKGYSFAEDRKSMRAAAKAKKLLGLFSLSHMPYKIDRTHDSRLSSVPNLDEMFKVSLNVLSQNEKGFVVQLEAGRVDHSAHENDAAATLHEQLEFDQCIKIARKFVKDHPDTLLIVTTDHGTGGCQLNGARSDYADTPKQIANISKIKGSFSSLGSMYRKSKKFDSAGFEELTSISVTPEKAAEVEKTVPEIGGWFGSAVGHVFAEEMQAFTGIGWTSHQHTAEHVEFVAMGPGREAFPPLFDNNEVYGILRNVLKI